MDSPRNNSIVEDSSNVLGLTSNSSNAVTTDADDSILCSDDVILDTMDSCVACVDNIDAQHQYEENLRETQEHGLTSEESAQMRLQVMDEAAATESAAYFPDLGELNICGQDDLDDARTTLHCTTGASTSIPVKRTAAASPIPASLHCAICLEEVENFQNTAVTFCHLPCCGSQGREARSSTKVCTACMLLLSSPTSDGSCRIGRCPRCRSWIVVKEAGLSIEAVENAGQCLVCNQVKEHLVEPHVCDACFLGRRRPLYYECKECHAPQRIPHPMYRYQPSVDSFGNTSWACQGQCKIFTMWRILPDQVRYIPAGDAPEEWGDDYLETARERVMEARRNMLELNRVNGSGGGGACTIQ